MTVLFKKPFIKNSYQGLSDRLEGRHVYALI